jgi:hypothetical protein
MDIINTSPQKGVLLEPKRLGIKDRIDLWSKSAQYKKYLTIQKLAIVTMKILKLITGYTLTLDLALAIQKK